MTRDLKFESNVALAAMTTLGVGGPARHLVRVQTETEIRQALEKAHREELDVLILGGGSNLLVSDQGLMLVLTP